MAIVQEIFGESGGAPTETTLWSNDSPTSAFAAGTINLSDSIANYDAIQFKYRMSTANDNTRTNIYPKSDYMNNANFTLADFVASLAVFQRILTKDSNTSFSITTAYRWNTSSTSSNNYIIPIEVAGLKY